MPEPAMTYAIEPKSRADEDKLAPAVHKLMEDDPMVRFFRDAADQRIPAGGRGATAHRILVPSCAPLPHRRDAEGAQGALPGNDARPRRGTRQAQEAERRPRTIRRLPDAHRAAAARLRVSTSSTRSSAGQFLAPLFRRSRRAFTRRRHAVSSPDILSSTSEPSCTTAATTMSTRVRSPSGWPGESPSANAWNRPSRLYWSR